MGVEGQHWGSGGVEVYLGTTSATGRTREPHIHPHTLLSFFDCGHETMAATDPRLYVIFRRVISVCLNAYVYLYET